MQMASPDVSRIPNVVVVSEAEDSISSKGKKEFLQKSFNKQLQSMFKPPKPSQSFLENEARTQEILQQTLLMQNIIAPQAECRDHQGEEYRHVCMDHQKILCPKCLIKHKQCDFVTANEVFTFQNKQKLRQMIKIVN